MSEQAVFSVGYIPEYSMTNVRLTARESPWTPVHGSDQGFLTRTFTSLCAADFIYNLLTLMTFTAVALLMGPTS